MKTFRVACALGLLAFALGGCASGPEAVQATPAPQSAYLGAGDAIGRHLARSDRAIAGAKDGDRALASHPDD